MIIKGFPHSAKELKKLFNDSPSVISYRGVSAEYLETCDRMYELMQDIVPPEQENEEPKYLPQKMRKRSLKRERESETSEEVSDKDDQSFSEQRLFYGEGE